MSSFAIFLYILAGIALLIWILIPVAASIYRRKFPPPAPSTSSTTTSASSTSTTTSPSPAPAPAPAAAKSWARLWWWILIIAVIAFGGWWATKSLSPPVSTPQLQAPRHVPQVHRLNVPLKLVGGKKLTPTTSGDLHIGNGGHTIFKVYDLPYKPNARYTFKLLACRSSDGEHRLEVNQRGTFAEKHPGDITKFVEIKFVFSSPSEINRFQEGENRFKFYSLDDTVIVRHPTLEVVYRE